MIDQYYQEKRCEYSPDLKECKSKVKEEEVSLSPRDTPLDSSPAKLADRLMPTIYNRTSKPMKPTGPIKTTKPTEPNSPTRPTRPSPMVNQSVRVEERDSRQHW